MGACKASGGGRRSGRAMCHHVIARLAAFAFVLAVVLGSAACTKHAPSYSASPGYDAPPSHAAGAPPPGESAIVEDGSAPAGAADATVASRVPARERLGLGTSFGEHRHSEVVTSPFSREAARPELVMSLRYDDFTGVDAAARRIGGGSPLESRFGTADGLLVVSLLDEIGRPLPAADIGGERWAVGEPGQRYMIGVENRSSERWEVVTSVDGLDVIDGEPAALHKRGYIIDPWSSITIDGWRTSESGVAAFRFSALEDSYAGRKGHARNVGVVGVAFFRERGAPRWDDTARRRAADPFPGRFADPPAASWR